MKSNPAPPYPNVTNIIALEMTKNQGVKISEKKSGGLRGNLLSFLLRCGTRPYERGTQ